MQNSGRSRAVLAYRDQLYGSLSLFLCLLGVISACPTALAGSGHTNTRVTHKVATDNLVISPELYRSLKRMTALLQSKKHAIPETDRVRERAERAKRSALRKSIEKEDGLDYLEAYRWYYRQRAYPNDRMDWNALVRAATRRDEMPATPWGNVPTGSENTPLQGKWSFVGPTHLSVPYQQYYGQGDITGRVNAAAFDPKTAGTYFVGAAGGGVWVTRDSGATWTPLSDTWPTLNVSSLVIDPTNNKNILVGTGDFPGGYGFGIGVMRSTNGGTTWTNTLKGSLIVSSMLFNPDNPKIVFATVSANDHSQGNLYRSSDGGATWKSLFPAGSAVFWSVVVSAPDATKKSRTYYALSESNGVVTLYSSTDAGTTWKQLSIPFGFSYLTTSPTDSKTLYTLSNKVIHKTVDGGATWTDITGNFPNGDQSYNWSQYGYDSYIACGTRTDSSNKPVDVVYVGLIDVAQSEDAGATWRSIGGPTFDQNNSLIHNDQHALAFNPNNAKELLIGNDGGLYRLEYDHAASTLNYTSLNTNLHITQFYKAAYHPTDKTRLLGGAQDNATPTSTGDITTWVNVAGGDGGYTAINPLKPDIQFAEAQDLSLFMTTDNWQSSIYNPPPDSGYVAFIAPFTLDPSQPDLLYAGTTNLWQYKGSTDTWTQKGTPDGNIIDYIAVAPTDSKRIYVGTDTSIFVSQNGGMTWTSIQQGKTALPSGAVTSIAVDPTDANRIIVSLSGTGHDHIWICANATAASAQRVWTDAGAGLPDTSANMVALDPGAPLTTFYVATDVGVFVTQNAGKTWTNATAPLGLPNAEVNDIHLVPGQGYLYAATYGRGIWRIPVVAALQLQSLKLASPTVYGGLGTSATVHFNKPAGANGLKVTLSSSKATVATVPAEVDVKPGASSASFAITTSGVSSPTPVTLTANYAGQIQTAVLTVNPATVAQLQVDPATIKGGKKVAAKATLNGVTGPLGLKIVITSSDTAVASVPGTVYLKGGVSFYRFSISTTAVTRQQTVTITATTGTVSQTATITVTP